MKFIVFFQVLFCVALLNAQPPSSQLATSPTNAIDRTNFVAKREGLSKTNLGPSFVFIDAQKRVPSEKLSFVVGIMERIMRFNIKYKQQVVGKNALIEVKAALKEKDVSAIILICDSPDYPSLLVAPESKWALVNVAALAEDSPNAETLSIRTEKELWRAFAYLMGAANSSLAPCLMKSVLTLDDLDKLTAKCICPEPYGKIIAHARKMGIAEIRHSLYRKSMAPSTTSISNNPAILKPGAR